MKKAECKEDVLMYFFDFVRWEGVSLISENLDSYCEGEELQLDIKITFIPYSDIQKFRDLQMIKEVEEHMGRLIKAKITK